MEVKHTVYGLGELFCGPGGIARGARDATVKCKRPARTYSVRHVWANDIDSHACDTYAKNNPTARVVCADVADFVSQFDSMPSVDAISFGFPCNDFSAVGERRGLEGRYGPLYTYGVRALLHFRPQWFIAENVSGLLHSAEGAAFRQILDQLRFPLTLLSEAERREHKPLEYTLTPHLYRFEQYGVPQTRHRIVIAGIRADLGKEFLVPRPPRLDRSLWVTAQEALSRPYSDDQPKNNELPRHGERVLRRLAQIMPGENAWTADLDRTLRLNVKGATLSQIYRRLRPDRPSYTITGSGGGGTHVYHYDMSRGALTNREKARLQSFPDDYEFCGTPAQVRRQIGMSVPPKAAAAIIRAMLKTLAGIGYRSIKATW